MRRARREVRGDGLSPVVIHRRLRLASYRRTNTEDEFTQTRVTNNRSVRPLHLRVLLVFSLPLRFHSVSPPAETHLSGKTGR